MLTDADRASRDPDDARDVTVVVTVSVLLIDNDGNQVYKARGDEAFYPNAEAAIMPTTASDLTNVAASVVDILQPGLQHALDQVVWGR